MTEQATTTSTRFAVTLTTGEATAQAIIEALAIAGLEATVTIPGTTGSTQNPTPCLCGCGELATGKKANFAPGHDMKLKSVIVTEIKAGREWSEALTEEQHAYAVENWHKFITDALDRKAAKAKPKAEEKPVEEPKAEEKPAEEPKAESKAAKGKGKK